MDMNLYAAVQAAHGSRVRRAGILRRRRSITNSRSLWEFFTMYADETTKTAYIAPKDVGAGSEEEYLRAVLAGKAPLRPEIDYVPFRGRVNAFGGASRPEIYRTHWMESLPDDERVARLRRWWTKDTAELPVKAHHVVFTLDPRLAAAMGQSGASVDAFLLGAVSNAFSEFQSRFYPGDMLSYLVALHHDRVHVHAHVLVHPLTQNGTKVNLSILRRYKVGDRYVDVPCQQVLKDSFERETEEACERYLPKAEGGYEKAREQREELAEELMLLVRARLDPEVKQEKPLRLESLIRVRDRLLADPDYLALVGQGCAAETHLIAEHVATGKLFRLAHIFGSIADKATEAQFATAAQARAVLGMFSSVLEKPSILYIEGIGVPIPSGAMSAPGSRDGPRPSFSDEVSARTRSFRESAEENARLRKETALLRARILHEDKTETECLIASADALTRVLEAAAPTLGEGPDILELWTPAKDGRPRLRGRKLETARLDETLTRAASDLAARHQPVNLAEHEPSLAATQEGPEGEIHSLRIIGAQPGFWARYADVHLDDLLTLTPSATAKPSEPTPG